MEDQELVKMVMLVEDTVPVVEQEDTDVLKQVYVLQSKLIQ